MEKCLHIRVHVYTYIHIYLSSLTTRPPVCMYPPPFNDQVGVKVLAFFSLSLLGSLQPLKKLIRVKVGEKSCPRLHRLPLFLTLWGSFFLPVSFFASLYKLSTLFTHACIHTFIYIYPFLYIYNTWDSTLVPMMYITLHTHTQLYSCFSNKWCVWLFCK